jgi:hypothetical protein
VVIAFAPPKTEKLKPAARLTDKPDPLAPLPPE